MIRTSSSSSLVGLAVSLRDSSIAFLKAGVWATIAAEGFVSRIFSGMDALTR